MRPLTAGALALENGLKYSFHRARPVPFFGSDPTTYSFPSGHELFSLCFYGVLAIIAARAASSKAVKAGLWITTGVHVLASGTTRIYVGVHYPSDVLAGYRIAIAWITALLAVERRLRSEAAAPLPPNTP